MKKFELGNRRKKHAGKVITAALVGSVVGATVGLLMAPSSGRETLRRLRGEALGPEAARERLKTARGNVESQARGLASDVRETIREARGAISHRRNLTPPTVEEGSP